MNRLYVIGLFLSFCSLLSSQKQIVWIDADTGNEMDDVYAITRLLADTTVNVAGLSSAHFNNPDLLVFEKWNQYQTKNICTVEISQKLNKDMLKILDRSDIPCLLGADRQIGRAWGGYEPRVSVAIEKLVSVVKGLGSGEKLDVICLGALTNIASAIILYPEIIPHITCYMLGAGYDSQTGVWNKNEFNIRNDLNAFDYLLNNAGIDLVIMPITTALSYRFNRDDTFSKLKGNHPVRNMLKGRWLETNPDDKERVLWDLALVEVYLKPQYGKMERVLTPLENTRREICVYTQIDENVMYEDFWAILSSLF